jgi:hypothetical protein
MVVKKGGKKSSSVVPLPVGHSREDDPPRGIRNNNKGLNYYYQGKTDACVLGGLAVCCFLDDWAVPSQRLAA